MKKSTASLLLLSILLTACVGKSAEKNDLTTTELAVVPPSKNFPQDDIKYIHTENVTVVDGDTIKFPFEGETTRIRLAGIDAPERNQTYGSDSTARMQACVQDKKVTVEWYKKDRYGRLVGFVFAEDANGKTDCNFDMVLSGSAWHYKDYQDEQTLEGQQAYTEAENYARTNKLGLWQDNNPTAPWDFRKQ